MSGVEYTARFFPGCTTHPQKHRHCYSRYVLYSTTSLLAVTDTNSNELSSIKLLPAYILYLPRDVHVLATWQLCIYSLNPLFYYHSQFSFCCLSLDVDFRVVDLAVTFLAGAVESCVQIMIVDDSIALERNETVIVTFAPPSGIQQGSPPSSTVTIIDNDGEFCCELFSHALLCLSCLDLTNVFLMYMYVAIMFLVYTSVPVFHFLFQL